MAVRTFFALDLDETTRDHLIEACGAIDEAGGNLRWVTRPQLHVTMKFIGDVADEMTAEVFSLAQAAAAEVEPFDFDVRGLVCVPPRGALRMIWANVIDPTGRMGVLHENLDNALAGLGLKEEERDFRPHVTLCRVKSPGNEAAIRQAAARFADEDFGPRHVRELVAYSSILTPEGPIYTAVARAPLGR